MCFVDIGVYTRNRIFRILGSVKYGKPTSAALRIAEANEFPFPGGFGNELFYKSNDNECDDNIEKCQSNVPDPFLNLSEVRLINNNSH